MTDDAHKPYSAPSGAVAVDPSDLPLDTPAGDDGDDRANDIPAEHEKP